MTHCFTYRGLDWCMLALIGCTWNDYPHWSAPCMPPVVPPPPTPHPHLGPAPAGLLSLVWAARRRSASTSGRSTLRLLPCRAVRQRTRRRRARRDRTSLRARRKPRAAPAQRRRASLRAMQSQVREAVSALKYLLAVFIVQSYCYWLILMTFALIQRRQKSIFNNLCTLAEKAKKREIINNLNNKRNTTNLLPTSMSTSTTASQVKRVNGKKTWSTWDACTAVWQQGRIIKMLTVCVAGIKQASSHWSPGVMENISEEGGQLCDSGLSWAIWPQPGHQQTSRVRPRHEPLCLQPPPQLWGWHQGTQALAWFIGLYTHETTVVLL